ncbi:MAG: nucleotidyl transferase AbiEii/AbiGii toxin family protein [Candidatus Nanoarchaeia archaeon]
MDITLDELKIISDREGFNLVMTEKDYLITSLLYALKEVNGIYFKGGTAINKLLLNNTRLSEDLDFSVIRNLDEVIMDIKERLKGTMFNKIEKGKEVSQFTRLIVHYKLFHESGNIFIDLNQRANLLLNPEKLKVSHFYKENLSEFEINCLNKDEMIAEKLRATIERYKPRDYIDLYNLLKSGFIIDINLVKKKMKNSKKDFDVKLIFQHTNKVFRLWEKDLSVITREKIGFKC